MKSVREEYKGIAQKAQDCCLIVEGDTVTLFDESDDDLAIVLMSCKRKLRSSG